MIKHFDHFLLLAGTIKEEEEEGKEEKRPRKETPGFDAEAFNQSFDPPRIEERRKPRRRRRRSRRRRRRRRKKQKRMGGESSGEPFMEWWG